MLDELFTRLADSGIRLKLRGDSFEVIDPGKRLTASLLDTLKLHKPEILRYLAALETEQQVITVKPAEKREYYPLSSAQTRIYFLNQLDNQSLAYNIPSAFEIAGRIDGGKLRIALQRLINRHEILRTAFRTIGNVPVQLVHGAADISITEYENGETINNAMQHFIQPFDLAVPPLIRVGLVKGEKPVLLMDLHHIVTDAISFNNLANEFIQLYADAEPEKPGLQYKDFVMWHRHRISTGALAHQQQYWLQEFVETVPVLDIPADFKRPEVKSYKGATLVVNIDNLTAIDIRRRMAEEGVTAYMYFLSVFSIFLSRLSYQTDIVIGTPVSGRTVPALHKMTGVFINTLPLRLKPDPYLKYNDYLAYIKRKVIDALGHQEYPYEELINQLRITREVSRNPLFDVMFAADVQGSISRDDIGFALQDSDVENTSSKLDLSLFVDETASGFQLRFEYATSLFTADTIARFSGFYLRMLECVLRQPDITLGRIPLISDEEKFLIAGFNDTAFAFERGRTVLDFFYDQVKKNPGKIAVRGDHEDMTYGMFHARTNSLARALTEKGIGRNDIVALYMERGVPFLLSVFAVLKAGAAYMPVSPSLPAERAAFMLKDSQAKIVMTSGRYLPVFPDVIDLDLHVFEDTADTATTLYGDDLAYVIYTSGSTGTPKGVMIRHHSLLNRIYWMQHRYALDDTDVILHKTPVSFDVSVWEIYWWAVAGCTVSVLPYGLEKDPYAIFSYLERDAVSVIHFVPAMLNAFTGAAADLKSASLKWVFASGEALLPDLVNKFNRTIRARFGARLINLYGPTEATVDVTCFECYHEDHYEAIPIGKPIYNTSLHILNEHGLQQPVGTIGELCIGGENLAAGYLNNEALTSLKFVFNEVLQQRVYRTGDLARWSKDGNVEFLGRMDHQLKIRGYRIEPGEIEHQLRSIPGITETVVVAQDTRNGSTLCAYYVCHQPVEASSLREKLGRTLPEYMVPDFFIEMKEIFLTPNGKVDRKRLPIPDIRRSQTYTAPVSKYEIALQELWAEVLGTDKELIGTETSFFQLGGHSIMAIAILSRLKEKYQVVYPLMEFFKHPTIRDAAAFLEQSVPQLSVKTIPPAELKEYYRLSPAQRRIYFWQVNHPESTAYNIPFLFRLTGEVDDAAIPELFRSLTAVHEILRTQFIVANDEPVQQLTAVTALPLRYYDGEPEDLVKPFDLSRGPLMRLGLLKGRNGERRLFVDLHHIIADGFSIRLLMDDFAALLSGHMVEKKRIQYKDYCEWQYREKDSAAMSAAEAYWTDQLSGGVPVINLPYDFELADNRYNGSNLRFSLTSDQSRFLAALAEEEGVTLFTVCFAVFSVLLSRMADQEELIIGVTQSGREQVDEELVAGPIINMLPVRVKVAEKINFRAFVKATGDRLINTMEHGAYPYDELAEKLHVELPATGNLLFDVACSFYTAGRQNAPEEATGWELLPLRGGAAKFKLGLYIEQEEDHIHFDFEYNTACFREKTIARFIDGFMTLVRQIMTNSHDLKLVGETEQEAVIKRFSGAGRQPEKEMFYQKFVKMAEARSQYTALVFGEDIINYGQLVNRVDALSGLLAGRFSLHPQNRVAVAMKRSPGLIVGLLALLRLNLVFVPLDPDLPEELIRFILKDAGVSLVIADNDFYGKYHDKVACPVYVETAEDMTPDNQAVLPAPVSGSDLAYIIYTSGSTGRPKGVMIGQDAFMNYLNWANNFYCKDGDGMVMGLFTPVSFDFTLTCIFSTLLRGDKLVVYGHDRDISDILSDVFNVSSGINFIKLTPSHVNILSHLNIQSTGVSAVILGGEELLAGHIAILRHLRPDMAVYNEYGPTEATVGCCIKEISGDMTDIGIGVPIDNVSVLVLDRYGNLLPVGVEGELCIAGVQLAQGYTDQEQSLRKFVVVPGLNGLRVYRTGDKGKFLENGELAYLGRMDDQVKIRGYRVELKQVAGQLAAMDGIIGLHIDTRKMEDGSIAIVAYYRSDIPIDHQTFIRFAARCLPEYMVPSYFVRMDQIPLNINGKVDRKKLPDPVTVQQQHPETAGIPEIMDGVTQQLREIWAGILQKAADTISLRDNFYELGGQSIRSIMLVSRIMKAFNVKLEVRQVLHAPTLKEQAQLIKATTASYFRAIKPVEKREYYTLSNAQARLLALSRLDPDSLSYNMPSMMRVTGNLDRERLEQALYALQQRHEILRSTFHIGNGNMYQMVAKEADFNIEYLDYAGQCPDPEMLMTRFVRPFRLDEAPAWRLCIVVLADNSHIMLHDMHHIIADGTSGMIFVRDFIDLYHGIELTPLAIQYKDFSNWQQQVVNHSRLQQERAYWLEAFKELPQLLNLPFDFPPGRNRSNDGERAGITLSGTYATILRELAVKEEVTMFSIILAAFNVLIGKCCSQQDVVVGIPFECRNHADLADQIGIYLNLLPLRNFPEAGKSFTGFVREVQNRLSSAMENADYQFEQLLDELKLPREEGRDPLFDIFLNYLNFETATGNDIPELTFSQMDTGQSYAKYALSFYISEQDDGLDITCVYKRRMFKASTISYLLQELNRLLESIAEDATKCIGDYQLFRQYTPSTEKPSWPAGEIFQKQDIFQSVGKRFEQQVLAHAANTAIVYGEQRLTYDELNRRVNQVANVIWQTAGQEASGNIALLLSDRISAVVGMLGVLKTSFSYVPLDVTFPLKRLDFILKSCNARYLITTAEHEILAQELVQRNGGMVVRIDDLTAVSTGNPGFEVSCHQPAYILYTSGSTGAPKGVVQSHRNALHFCRVYTNRLGIRPEDRLSLFSTYCFDAALMDILGALLNGAALYPYDVMKHASMHHLKEWIVLNRISIYHSVPNLYRQLYKSLPEGMLLPSVRYVVMGGEPVYSQDVMAYKAHFSDECIFINGLGPTESTVTLQKILYKHSLVDKDIVPVGGPVEETDVLILDETGAAATVFAEGEIVYQSDYLALGYWDDIPQSNRAFVKDLPGEKRYYRSGDIGRRLPDGEIEFTGRKDKQVKVRGFRIELAEIENNLLQFNRIAEVVVVYQENSGNGMLICFYKAGNIIPAAEFRRFLQERIPVYMIPDRYVKLETLPVNTNGKTDRKLLSAYVLETPADTEAPAVMSAFELTFSGLWKELVNIDNIQRHDYFFNLGGNSITLIALLSRIERVYGVSLPAGIFITQPFHEIATVLEDSVVTTSYRQPIQTM
ncbi:non-ribosomal peptide synthetase [Chitinophaga sp.]|uniref:non-ribosomal peptide synthetase n=1 Tax=Chitinophaga sp. TaxID=1869181 RepID=UPI002C35C435|nr:non-ribosomal peptide synthetase [Chitinophaga sp.]HWV64276.1 amino acid adenylation domain-containing protein [Chitinophaga sp.]